MRQRIATVAQFLLVLATATAFADDLEKALNDQYKDKVLALRHPVDDDKQEYDSQGLYERNSKEAPWTLLGRLRVEKIQVSPEILEVRGARVAYRVDNQKLKEVADRKNRRHCTVRIKLEKPLAEPSDATDVLGRVFALSDQEIVKASPLWWQPYLSKMYGLTTESSGAKPSKKEQSNHAHPDDMKTYSVGATVTAPKVLRRPEPEFTKEARKARYQGTVGMNVIVDREGRIRDPKIVRALGMGLDDSAVETVSTWTFRPATKDGQPVAVMVYIEVDFHLYDGKVN